MNMELFYETLGKILSRKLGIRVTYTLKDKSEVEKMDPEEAKKWHTIV